MDELKDVLDGIGRGNVYGLLLSEVKNYRPGDFSSCRVYYRGIIGDGTSWAYFGGGEHFDFEITPEQACLMSRVQDDFAKNVLEDPDLDAHEKALLEGLPETLRGNWGDTVTISSYAQTGMYDLLK